MSPVDSVRTVLSKYTTFSGRARRSEYWWFVLATLVVYLVVEVPYVATRSTVFAILFSLVALALILPSLAVLVRRLHDTGRSGWWYFIGLIPFVGSIILLVFMVQDSKPGSNQYGPSPKEAFGHAGYGDPSGSSAGYV